MTGSVNSSTRSRTHTGSISSNASSLRKRFGLDTLSRSNSKIEHDSGTAFKMGAVWRTLSNKGGRSAATGEQMTTSNTLKMSLGRSRSIDTDSRLLMGTPRLRPTSKDRPTVLGAFDNRPGSSHATSVLDTITASPPPDDTAKPQPKKKRRSSLSDLKTLVDAQTSLDKTFSPMSPSFNRMNSPRHNASPRTPSPTKGMSRIPCSTGSPVQRRQNSPNAMMKSNAASVERATMAEKSHNINNEDPAATRDQTGYRKGHSQHSSISGIPTLRRAPLQERSPFDQSPKKTVTSGSTESSPKKSTSPTKLKMQSPQKVRHMTYTLYH
jgi:hypothetical protein